jgi:hypothetical protein
MNLDYISKNNKNFENKSSKIINIYNLRFFDESWLSILFTKIPEEVSNLLKVLYDCNIKFDISYLSILKKYDLINLLQKTEKELFSKTFIKYFFDNNMINEEFLLDISIETNNNSLTYILNYHNTSEEFFLDKTDLNNIYSYKQKNSSHDIDKYYIIKDKYIYDDIIFYTQELIKFKNKWWLITTKWNRYYYKYKEIKIILSIFSELI